MHRDTMTSDNTTCVSRSATGNETGGELGYWTDTFTELHHAATTGAPAAEVEQLVAAELAALGELDRWAR